jgi:serine protease inhibitor
MGVQYSVDIQQYGAVADAKTVNTGAIQKAIDACHAAGGGRVLCGPGTFLPDLGSDLKTFHEQLTYDNWEQWLAGFSQKRGRLAIPRFRLDFKVQLNRTLQELGMAIAFDANRADFSGMRPVSPGANLSISEVIHQSFLLVNEKGTEAAAATSVGMRLTSAPMYQFNFIADRPFFLVIRDEMTGAMLFMGSVLAPNAAEANSD